MSGLLLPDAEIRGFVFASFEWLLSGFGGLEQLVQDTRLVTPTYRDFPVYPGLEEQDLVEDYFAFVREHAGIAPELRFEIVGMRRGLRDLAETVPRRLHVAYPAEAVADPELLVAYEARGAFQHLIQTLPRCPPGGWEMLGPAAEVATVFSGFGLFLTNTGQRVRRGQPPIPLGLRGRWHLSQRALAYALAVFGWIKEIPDRLILSYLAPNPRAFYRAAVRDLGHRGPELTELRGCVAHDGPYR